MLEKIAKKYYHDKGYNCAESILLATNEYYHLNLNDNDFQLVTAFGGGLGCGRICGALTGGLAALGRIFIVDKETMHNLSTEFIADFENKLETSICIDLKEKYKTEDFHCLKTVELAAIILENFISKNKNYTKIK